MRKQLEDYSEPLPPGLWEAIEKDLNQSSVQPKVVPLWRRWPTVAAAVVAVLVVSSALVWLWRADDGLVVGQVPLVADVTAPDPDAESLPPAGNDVVESVTVVKQVPNGKVSLLAAFTSPSGRSESLAGEGCAAVMKRETLDLAVGEPDSRNGETGQPEADERAVVTEQRRAAQRKADREQLRRNALLAVADKPSASRNWQIGVTAGNPFFSASNSFQGLATLMSRNGIQMNDLAMNSVSDNSMAYTQVLFHNRDQATETRVHHRMPVTVGATVSYAFSDRWSLETGLTYTLLSSELHSGARSYIEEEQKLHYVGIPLKVKHTFWQNGRLSFYAAAGGAVEKCVSGSMETLYVTGSSDRKTEHISLDVKALQWSVNAAVGGQFNLIHRLGVYVEPGVSYYFDDGTGIETYRKEHPCNFNLQLGLRFTFSK